MPLKVKQRGNRWVAYGRIHLDGIPITEYYHNKGTGASTEAGALTWVEAETTRQKRRYLLGDEERFSFVMAVLEYDAKPADADYLSKIIDYSPELAQMDISKITGHYLKKLGLKMYPSASTDTVLRQFVTPVRSVVNNMHHLGKGPYLRVKDFTEKERVDRDTERGIQSRVPRTPATKGWIDTFRAHADPYNAALAAFLFETAARIDQAISLMPDDRDLMNCKVRIKASKGHPEQWIDISQGMRNELANLPPKQPHNRKTGEKYPATLFGYGTRGGYRKAWKRICKTAGIQYISAHPAGRHGFATHVLHTLGVKEGSAMKAGRWKTQSAFNRYDHPPDISAEIRSQIRTKPEHLQSTKPTNHMKGKG